MLMLSDHFVMKLWSLMLNHLHFLPKAVHYSLRDADFFLLCEILQDEYERE